MNNYIIYDALCLRCGVFETTDTSFANFNVIECFVIPFKIKEQKEVTYNQVELSTVGAVGNSPFFLQLATNVCLK